MELNTYPLVCTRGVVLYPNQEIVIDVGRDTSVHAVENAQDNYDKKICLFSQKELEQEKKNQQEKQKMLAAAQKRQENLNTVIQASSLITASANLWSSFSSIPIVLSLIHI